MAKDKPKDDDAIVSRAKEENPAVRTLRERVVRGPERHDTAAAVPVAAPAGRGETGISYQLNTSGELLLSAEEAARGGTFPLDIPVRSTCTTCQGRSESWSCVTCAGEGAITVRLPAGLRLPPGVRDGAVFQIHMDAGVPVSVVLTVHIVR
jgi:hypothetical protein